MSDNVFKKEIESLSLSFSFWYGLEDLFFICYMWNMIEDLMDTPADKNKIGLIVDIWSACAV